MSTQPAQIPPDTDLWAQRTGPCHYVGKNTRGACVEIGKGPGQFSPGELLKLALATCNGLSADQTIAASLGEGFAQIALISANYNDQTDAYQHFEVQLLTDLSGLDPDRRARLLVRADRAIDTHCTIAHTLTNPVQLSKQIIDKSV